MPILLLPIIFLHPNPELPQKWGKETEAWSNLLGNEIGMRGVRQVTRWKSVGQREWGQDFDAALQTSFLMTENEKSIGAKMGALVRRKDCVVLGARVEGDGFSGKWPNSLKEVLPRKPLSQSSFGVEVLLEGTPARGLRDLLVWQAVEALAGAGFPVVSPWGRVVCESVTGYPGRMHRWIHIQGSAKGWDVVSGKASLVSGPFANVKEKLFDLRPGRLNLGLFTGDLLAGAQRVSHSVVKAPVRIVRRDKNFVYLDRGKAWGLWIGARLLGPQKEELHVIEFAPTDKEVDGAVAMIRKETAASPLKPGDALVLEEK